MPQDLPPIGGYSAVQYKVVPTLRPSLPTTTNPPLAQPPNPRPLPVWYLLGVVAIMGYGWRQVFIGGREKNELAREKMWSRIYLTPLLQAEEDRDQARRHFADLAREKELLGSTTSAYNSDRFVRPTYAITPGYTAKN